MLQLVQELWSGLSDGAWRLVNVTFAVVRPSAAADIPVSVAPESVVERYPLANRAAVTDRRIRASSRA